VEWWNVDGRTLRQSRGFEHFIRMELVTIEERFGEWLQAFY